MMRSFAVMLLLILVCRFGFSQELRQIDSLKSKLSHAKTDTDKVKLMVNLTFFYKNYTDIDSARKYALDGLALARKTKFYRGEAAALREFGFTYRVFGDIPKSLECEFEALHIAEEKNYPLETAWCLNGLGVIYDYEIHDYPKAIEYFRRAQKISNTLKPDSNQVIAGDLIANLNVNIGTAFRDNHQLDSANFYIKKIFAKKGYDGQMSYNGLMQMELGDIAGEQGNVKLARDYRREGLLATENRRENRHTCLVYYYTARNFLNARQVDSSIYYAQKGLALAQSQNNKMSVLNTSTVLAEDYELKKDVNNALHYHEIARLTDDEIYGPKKVQYLLKIISDEQEHEYAVEKAKTDYENGLKQYALLAGLAVMILIGYILFRNNQRERKAKQQLREKNEVIESTLTNLRATQTQLIQSEKMASLGELTAGIAHEIQNPLNFVNNFSEVNTELIEEMKQEIGKGNLEEIEAIAADIEENSKKINMHGKRADGIVKGMLQHSQAGSGAKEAVDINALASDYMRLAYHGWRRKTKISAQRSL